MSLFRESNVVTNIILLKVHDDDRDVYCALVDSENSNGTDFLTRSGIMPLFEVSHDHGEMCFRPKLVVSRAGTLANGRLEFCWDNREQGSWSFGPKGHIRAWPVIRGTGLYSYMFSHLLSNTLKHESAPVGYKHDTQVHLAETDAKTDSARISRNGFYAKAGFLHEGSSDFMDLVSGYLTVDDISNLSLDGLNNSNVSPIDDTWFQRIWGCSRGELICKSTDIFSLATPHAIETLTNIESAFYKIRGLKAQKKTLSKRMLERETGLMNRILAATVLRSKQQADSETLANAEQSIDDLQKFCAPVSDAFDVLA